MQIMASADDPTPLSGVIQIMASSNNMTWYRIHYCFSYNYNLLKYTYIL